MDTLHPKVVLFDLDDTLFDHKHSRLEGLKALQDRFIELDAVPLETLEMEHESLLKADYGRVLDGAVTLVDARTLRIRNLCADHDLQLEDDEAEEAVRRYAESYDQHRRAVPGVRDLLIFLSSHCRLGVVTNGLVDAQMEKLRVCGLEGLFDTVVISEAVGHRKPEKEIFMMTLDRLDAVPSGAAHVGDSWETDILPAHGLGLKAYWLNRYGLVCPDPSVAQELKDFEGFDCRSFLTNE